MGTASVTRPGGPSGSTCSLAAGGPLVFREHHGPRLGSAPGLLGGDLVAPRGLLAKFLIGKNGVFTAQSSSTTWMLHRTLKHFDLVPFVGESFLKRLRMPLGCV